MTHTFTSILILSQYYSFCRIYEFILYFITIYYLFLKLFLIYYLSNAAVIIIHDKKTVKKTYEI